MPRNSDDGARYVVTVTETPKRDAFADPPLKDWFQCRLAAVEKKEGQYGTGYSFRFECADDDLPDVGSVWGTVWLPLHEGRPMYHWLKVLSEGEFEVGDKIVLQDYTDMEVEVFCQKATDKDGRVKTDKDGNAYINVTDLRLPGGGRKSDRRVEQDDDEEETKTVKKTKKKAKAKAGSKGAVPF